MAMVGCKGPNTPVGPTGSGNLDAIEKEWELVSVNGVANDFSVYISFDMGTFAIFQQVYTLDYKFYEGEYNISGDKLTGEYFEGGAWKCGYKASISEDGNTLTLVSDEASPITCVYQACTIPEEIRTEAISGTRCVEEVPFL